MHHYGSLEKLIDEVIVPSQEMIELYDRKKIISNLASTPGVVTFVNPLTVSLLEEPSYKQYLLRAKCVMVDGILLAKCASIFSGKNVDRYSFDGNSLAPYLFEYAKKHNKKIFFLGATQGIAAKAQSIVNETYQKKIVACAHSGYFQDVKQLLCLIERDEIDIIVVGMGAPLQDKVANLLFSFKSTLTIFTCGGYFDQIVDSENEQYYPEIVEHLNIRFLYRVFKEPKKMVKRYVVDYSHFYFACLAGLWKKILRK